MRRLLPAIVVVVVVLSLAWWLLGRRTGSENRKVHVLEPRTGGDRALAVEPAAGVREVPTLPLAIAEENVGSRGNRRTARAYRLLLAGDTCTLEAVEEIHGDFRKPRAQSWVVGRFCCRLLDAEGKLLAEETMSAPDHFCVVLDPVTTGQDGLATAAAFTPPGPITFQTRLPDMSGAARLEVIRLAGGPAASVEARPPGRLLASIPLVTR